MFEMVENMPEMSADFYSQGILGRVIDCISFELITTIIF